MRIIDEVDIAFRGKVIVFGGDFRQILPVIPRGMCSNIVHATINASSLWDHYFAKWILEIGDGNHGQPNDGYATIEIPPALLILKYIDPIDAIVQSTYANLTNHFMDPQFLQSRAILASINELVEQQNDYDLSIILGKNLETQVLIPRMPMSPSQSPWPFKLIRRHFPIIVSYPMTINKSKRQSFASVSLYLPKPVFSHGQ
ncbi:hypothetical protein JHK85_007040 [Glycine max]|uniref:ATP-dependent DNA helicase n=1 Tax=Glycine max TaxID=3847 RepID=A0A0R0KSB2_SOYBN|nr:hypothetical protein JHK85_007040 [Glycine max]KAH1069122.1 hypothetical protein GYH30_006632 [Glycine max]